MFCKFIENKTINIYILFSQFGVSTQIKLLRFNLLLIMLPSQFYEYNCVVLSKSRALRKQQSITV